MKNNKMKGILWVILGIIWGSLGYILSMNYFTTETSPYIIISSTFLILLPTISFFIKGLVTYENYKENNNKKEN